MIIEKVSPMIGVVAHRPVYSGRVESEGQWIFAA
jgi:hypothetical protein